jgi:hypothetical protein
VRRNSQRAEKGDSRKMNKPTPHCPVHVCAPMQLVAMEQRKLTPRGWKVVGVRPMWRCPVAGCARVEAWRGEDFKLDLKHNYGAPLSLWRWREILKQEEAGQAHG